MEKLNSIFSKNANLTNINELPKKISSNDDIEETYNLLKEFGIFISKKDIPKNLSSFDLLLWRKKQIKKYLNAIYSYR